MLIFSFWFALQADHNLSSMKAVPALVCILLMITSSAALPRKLVGNEGQQTGETLEKSAVNVDGRPSDGYGDHGCPRAMFPSCSERLEQVASNRLGWMEKCTRASGTSRNFTMRGLSYIHRLIWFMIKESFNLNKCPYPRSTIAYLLQGKLMN